LLAAALTARGSQAAATETGATEHLLHDFAPATGDGSSPAGQPLFVGPNTMYLTTASGGKYGDGAVVRLVRGSTAWAEDVIYSFTARGDGYQPSAGLIADRSGALYGTAALGGAGSAVGTVFKLTPSGTTWKETTLHAFSQAGKDGLVPSSSLIADAAGDLYGTTRNGGGSTRCNGIVFGCGVVFELKPVPHAGTYTEIILHRFAGGNDGANPVAGLLQDGTGALFGTTTLGGAYGGGVAFKLIPPKIAGGAWVEYAIRYFTGGADGGQPRGTLVADALGNLYGTTSSGGKGSLLATGTVFRLAPEEGSIVHYTFTSLHEFAGEPGDGSFPIAGVVLGQGGVIYGTTRDGGPGYDGTVYELNPPAKAGGTYASRILHGFGSLAGDTMFPLGGIARDVYGNLFGAGNTGVGKTIDGAVYEIAL